MKAARLYGIGALLLFVALPLGLIGWAVANLLDLSETESVIARQEALMGQLDARLARMNTGDRPPADLSAIYVKADAASLAAADLQSLLGRSIAEAGGQVIETQPIDAQEGDPADEIVLRLAFDIKNAGLADLLKSVEAGLPLIFIDGISIRQMPGRSENDDASDPLLRVETTLRAAWRKPS